jgi:hypothetical protein
MQRSDGRRRDIGRESGTFALDRFCPYTNSRRGGDGFHIFFLVLSANPESFDVFRALVDVLVNEFI